MGLRKRFPFPTHKQRREAMFRLFGLISCLLLCNNLYGQSTIVVSGFQGAGAGWTTHLEDLNGSWSLVPLPGPVQGWVAERPTARIIRTHPSQLYAGQHPPGAALFLTRNTGSREWFVAICFRTAVGYAPAMSFGIPNYQSTGTINVNAAPGDPRQIVVQ